MTDNTYVESAIVEDDALVAARGRAEELGAPTISPAVGALLALLARATGAKSVVEVGTGVGVSGLWLLAGMAEDGVLTTIDPEFEYQQAARESFAAADIPIGRARLINGSPIEVLPRLADASYELVFLDGEILDHPRYLTDAIRILRPGGVVVLHHAEGLDPSQSGPVAEAVRQAALIVADDDRFLPVVIPLGAGVLAAAKAG
ncbi:O-methyltransferase [Gordonia crocea]|uniref:Putative O-methyltransferase n=1 Tax=Gordonia crocea TaxID=589162 RepID=A0A7I9UWS6_9ACTN|nr:class I SAM-dependent methyltransferase [Gordonia crocea]GED97393.1 putative O-methyltransferase [Gordonia crocea]